MEKIAFECFSTARSETPRVSAIAPLDLPWAISARISDSLGVSHSRSDLRWLARARTSSSTTRGSMTDPPPATTRMAWASSFAPATRSFKQVAAAGRAFLQEGQRVGRSRVLAEDDDADRRLVLAQPCRGLDAFVGAGRGHAYVGHHDVGLVLGDELQQFGKVGGDADELEVVLGLDQPRDSLAQQRVVLRQDDPDQRHRDASLMTPDRFREETC